MTIGPRAEVRAALNRSRDALILRTFAQSPSATDDSDWGQVGPAVVVPRDQLPMFLTILEMIVREAA